MELVFSVYLIGCWANKTLCFLMLLHTTAKMPGAYLPAGISRLQDTCRERARHYRPHTLHMSLKSITRILWNNAGHVLLPPLNRLLHCKCCWNLLSVGRRKIVRIWLARCVGLIETTAEKGCTASPSNINLLTCYALLLTWCAPHLYLSLFICSLSVLSHYRSIFLSLSLFVSLFSFPEIGLTVSFFFFYWYDLCFAF